MHCWPVSLNACNWVRPLGDTGDAAVPSVVRKRQAAVQYLSAASRTTDGRERELLRRRAAALILAP